MCGKSTGGAESAFSSAATTTTTAPDTTATSTIAADTASTSTDAVSIVTSNESQPLVYIHNQQLRDSIVKAEILQCLNVVATHAPVRSADRNGDIYRAMFPDSEIARGYTKGNNLRIS